MTKWDRVLRKTLSLLASTPPPFVCTELEWPSIQVEVLIRHLQNKIKMILCSAGFHAYGSILIHQQRMSAFQGLFMEYDIEQSAILLSPKATFMTVSLKNIEFTHFSKFQNFHLFEARVLVLVSAVSTIAVWDMSKQIWQTGGLSPWEVYLHEGLRSLPGNNPKGKERVTGLIQ